jgi:hypothetical protein
MDPVIWIIASALVLSVIAVGILLLVCRPPQCPQCGSHNVEEYPAHGVCRLCGRQFNWEHRFGSHGGQDL